MRGKSCGRFVLAVALLLFAGSVRAANLPADFQETVLYTSQEITSASGLEWSPDGALWITTQTGQIYLHDSNTLYLAIDLYGGSFPGGLEQGVQNLVADPDYSQNQHVWVYYTVFPQMGSNFNRLSRLTRVGNALQDELPILEIPSGAPVHHGGCLAFAEDETLFLGVGEDTLGSVVAQDPFDLRGKILRLNRDGSAASGNPFADGSAGDPRVWAYGFRNPFRCSIQPDAAQALFINDVGGCCWEEINVGIPGANYGYRVEESPQPVGNTAITYPIFAYPHGIFGGAITGGDHIGPGELAPQFEGDYFFAEFSAGEIWRMDLERNRWSGPLWASIPPAHVAEGTAGSTEVWADGFNLLVDLEVGPDGALYYANYISSPSTTPVVGRIAYVPGANRAPVPVPTATPPSGSAPLMVTLDGSASSDPDFDSLTYSWDFGDGNFGSGATVMHSYPQGIYEAFLTVDDGVHPPVTSRPIPIMSGNIGPTATLLTPTVGTMFNAGQTIGFSGSASEPVGSPPCEWYTWQILRHDGPTTEVHQGPTRGGCSGSFTTAATGNPSPNVSYEVVFVVNDSGSPLGQSGALSDTKSVEIFPNTSQFTLETTPFTDLDLTLDGVPVTAPLTVQGVIDFQRTIGPVNGQLRPDGHRYSWISWSDGGAEEHVIQTPATPTTYTASFGCDVLVEAEQLTVDRGAGDNLSFSWNPISDSCLAPGPDSYTIYTSSVAAPATPPGSFPSDPAWSVVGTSGTTTFGYEAAAGDTFFLVVGKGTDLRDGPVGHYGF